MFKRQDSQSQPVYIVTKNTFYYMQVTSMYIIDAIVAIVKFIVMATIAIIKFAVTAVVAITKFVGVNIVFPIFDYAFGGER